MLAPAYTAHDSTLKLQNLTEKKMLDLPSPSQCLESSLRINIKKKSMLSWLGKICSTWFIKYVHLFWNSTVIIEWTLNCLQMGNEISKQQTIPKYIPASEASKPVPFSCWTILMLWGL